jgi:hypothetical protein
VNDIIITCWKNIDTSVIEIAAITIIAEKATKPGDRVGDVGLYDMFYMLGKIVAEYGNAPEWDQLRSAEFWLTWEPEDVDVGVNAGYVYSEPEWSPDLRGMEVPF